MSDKEKIEALEKEVNRLQEILNRLVTELKECQKQKRS